MLKARRTGGHGVRRMLTGVAIVASLVVATPGIAQAAWTAAATSKGYAKAVSVPQGNTPTTSVNGRDVTVSWAVARFPNTTPVAGYTVRRFDSSTGVPQTVLASCTGTIATLTCTEFGVAPGTWKYAVTPKQALWTGPESVQSAHGHGRISVAHPHHDHAERAPHHERWLDRELPRRRNGDLPAGQRDDRHPARRFHHAVTGAGRRLRDGERHRPGTGPCSARTRSSRSARSGPPRAPRSPSSTRPYRSSLPR